MIRFSDMAQRISTSGVSDKLPSVEFEDIVSGEGVLNKDVSRKNVVKKGVKFEKHDVLFGKLRPYLKNILYADFNGIAVGDFWVLRASEAVDPYFLYILVSTHQFMSVANISSGSKMPRADWNWFPIVILQYHHQSMNNGALLHSSVILMDKSIANRSK